MPGPATKLGSMTAHGGSVIGPGCPTVLINKVPAIRIGSDMHLCPMVTPGTPPIPHVGMTNVGPGVPTVLIGKMPASTVGDNFLCVGPPAPVVMGALNVLIGTGGGGGGGGGGGSSMSPLQALQAGAVAAIQGTQQFPIQIQAALLQAQQHTSSQGMQQIIAAVAGALNQNSSTSSQPPTPLTIKDIADILEAVERDEGFEAARFFAAYLDYSTLTRMAKEFISGENPEANNDPNVMPTRFMLLYGADDSKLQNIDQHPDCAEGESHPINVENLRKGLKLLGYDVAETGPYDDEVAKAHADYMASLMGGAPTEAHENSQDVSNQNSSNSTADSSGSSSGTEDTEQDDNSSPSEESTSSQQGNSVQNTQTSSGNANSSEKQNDTPQKMESITISIQADPNDPDVAEDKLILYSTDMGRKYTQTKKIKEYVEYSGGTVQLVFTGADPNLNYTLEYESGSGNGTAAIFRNRPFGKWS